jgi:ABC-type antimicrobial peptide transport system permease subunit
VDRLPARVIDSNQRGCGHPGLVVPGIGVGLVAAVFFVRVADPSWYSLGGVEPLVYSLAAAIAFVVAALAGIPSARRAAAVEPIVAIRAE